MNRTEKIEEIFKRHLPAKYADSKEKMHKYFWSNRANIFKSFEDVWIHGILQCIQKKKQVQHIVISILYSSSLTGSYELQIAFWNDRIYVEDNPVYEYWAPTFIFEQIEDDMQFFKKKIIAEVPRIKEYELESIRNAYILNHYFLVLILLMELIPAVPKEKYIDMGILAEDVEISFGRYMEKTILLYKGLHNEIFSS